MQGTEKRALLIEVHLRKPSSDLFFGKPTVGSCNRSYS
jgi:hypothetical protein